MSINPEQLTARLSAKFNISPKDVSGHPVAGQILNKLSPPTGLAKGGDVPRKTTIGGQKHELSYINDEEKQMLLAMGGSGEPGPGGIPAYQTFNFWRRNSQKPGGIETASTDGGGSEGRDRVAHYRNSGWTEGTPPAKPAEGDGTGTVTPPTDDQQTAADEVIKGAEDTTAEQTADLAAARQTQQEKVNKLQLEVTKLQTEDQTNPAIVASISAKNEQLLKAQNDLAAIGSTERAETSTKEKETAASFLDDPTSAVTKQTVAKIDADTPGTTIDEGGVDFDGDAMLSKIDTSKLPKGMSAATYNKEKGVFEYKRPSATLTGQSEDMLKRIMSEKDNMDLDFNKNGKVTPQDALEWMKSQEMETVEVSREEMAKQSGVSLDEFSTTRKAVGDPGATTDAALKTGTAEQVDDPEEIVANTYDASTSLSAAKAALEGGERDMTDPVIQEEFREFMGPFEEKVNAAKSKFEETEAYKNFDSFFRTMSRPPTEEQRIKARQLHELALQSPEYKALETEGKAAQDAQQTFVKGGEGLKAAQGELSDEAQATAQEGTASEDSLAGIMGVDKEFIKEVKAGTRTVSPDEIAEAAKRSGTPEAEIQQMLEDYKDVEGAKFDDGRPELEAQDLYNLTPTQIAEQTATTVRDAAKATEYSTAEAATTDYQSTVEAAEGTVGAEELVNAKDVIGTAKAVQAIAATDKALNDESIAIAAQGSLSQAALAKAKTGTVTPQSTVSGQMATLMEQFNDGTPAWAAGAMRAANAAMAARGMGASSMASAAIVQAAMESAIPIAQADAQTFASMNMQNLNNQQQVSLANAAAQQNMTLANLSNQQQAMLQNSTNAFSLQSQNLSNTQATVLANAQLKASFQNKTLDIKTQTSLANAAKYAETNQINLNNRQQANLQRASENLQVDMANLSNTQQTGLANLQVRAALIGQELTNDQQMAVLTSTQDFERAGFDASAKQQAFLQDAVSTAALEGKAMDIRQQTAVFNVSAQLEERKIELSNEQQATLFNSTNKVTIDLAEMSNRQQTALANAQIDAALEGKELDNRQQVAVLKAEKFAEAANITFTSEQNAQIHNSELLKTIGVTELSTNATIALQNAATVAGMDLANLDNRQQAEVLNAQSFLKMDLANLDNEQEVTMFKAQSIQAAILSDTGMKNAEKQFNATSQNQTDQFMSTLKSNTDQYNATQKNSMEQLNVKEENALAKFNEEQTNQRDEFIAENAVIIAQANATWKQKVVTENTAADNEANSNAAAEANDFTMDQIDAIWQKDRDLMSFAWKSADNDAQRKTMILQQHMQGMTSIEVAELKKSWESWGMIGSALIEWSK